MRASERDVVDGRSILSEENSRGGFLPKRKTHTNNNFRDRDGVAAVEGAGPLAGYMGELP